MQLPKLLYMTALSAFSCVVFLFVVLICQTSYVLTASHFVDDSASLRSVTPGVAFNLTLQVNELYITEDLEALAISRIPGSAGHAFARTYIRKSLKDSGMRVSIQSRVAKTPLGSQRFYNIIGDIGNPDLPQILLAAHYDSKQFDFEFIGMTDAAAPCAMLLNIARAVINEEGKSFSSSKYSLRLVFFDGEEAFKEWSAEDSLYGSRSYVASQELPSVLILLDLLGAASPMLASYYANTHSHYGTLMKAERMLQESGKTPLTTTTIFRNLQATSPVRGLQDDHTPFLNAGVPVLYITPIPFPRVWHTSSDDMGAYDADTTLHLTRCITLALWEWLHAP